MVEGRCGGSAGEGACGGWARLRGLLGVGGRSFHRGSPDATGGGFFREGEDLGRLVASGLARWEGDWGVPGVLGWAKWVGVRCGGGACVRWEGVRFIGEAPMPRGWVFPGRGLIGETSLLKECS